MHALILMIAYTHLHIYHICFNNQYHGVVIVAIEGQNESNGNSRETAKAAEDEETAAEARVLN